MTYTEPKLKSHCRLKPSQPLPLIKKASGEIHKFRGIFNDFCVVVEDEEDMKKLITMGYFGKASLSRNFPQFSQHKPQIVRRRVYEKRKELSQKVKGSPEKIIIVPDSDSDDDENYFTNLKPLYQIDYSGIQEDVHLTLEEAFFLASALNCLDISYEEKKLEIAEVWCLFQKNDIHFLPNYIAYYYFRVKNWVVKPGIKFGGDFLLYKQGPPFYHASFVVLIHVVDENSKEINFYTRRSMKYVHLMGINRLCETAGKELLICEIIWPSTVQHVSYEDLSKFTVREILMKRWISSQEEREKSDKEINKPGPSTSTF